MKMTRIHISLLPDEMRRQSSIMKIWTVIALVLAIIAMILLAGNILLAIYIQQPIDELERLKVEQQNLTEDIGRLSYIQQLFDDVEATEADIAGLRGVDPDWFYLINKTASGAGTHGIRVDRMELTTVGESPGCILTCWTSDIDNVNDWDEYLSSINGISDVQMFNIDTLAYSDDELEFIFIVFVGISKWKAE